MTRRILASHPDYFWIDLNQRTLCALLNKHMHKFEAFHNDLPPPEMTVAIDQVKDRISTLLEGGAIRDWLTGEEI